MAVTTIEPFVRNAWYVAAWPEELEKGLLARTIMNEPIVLYRDANGKVGALEDRCCHRGAPLTHGKVVQEGLQCGYHGLIYDTNGECVVIPGQKNVPREARVKSYPIVERQGFIWIWMGDAALADTAKLVDFPIHDMPEKFPHRKAMFHMKCNYMLMIDNLMDLTHLGYVHTKTIGGNPATHVAADMDITPTPTGVHFIRWMLDCIPPPTYQKGANFKGRVDRWQEFEYVAPASVLQWSGALDIGKGAQANRDQDGFHLRLYHGATPETENTFFYFWSTANGYRQDDPQATEDMYNEIYPTFLEDKEIMEVQHARVILNPERALVPIRADGALTLARRALRRMYDDEQAQLGQAAE
ncbi:MAG: aromatic ring-hydroxylating dioxygenase subunit alpha [Alphaproteobacteria bacterium]|nr:aromatic ring-hydroxylating dioxygenase subunit alpha [Alphaproteobacteria bacterium]